MYDHDALVDRIHDCIVQTVYDAVKYVNTTVGMDLYCDVQVFGEDVQTYMLDRLKAVRYDFDAFKHYMDTYNEWVKKFVQNYPAQPTDPITTEKLSQYENSVCALYIDMVGELQNELKELEGRS